MGEYTVILISLSTVLFLWAFFDLMKDRDSSEFSDHEKIICFIFILILPIFGPLFYLLLKKKFKSLHW